MRTDGLGIPQKRSESFGPIVIGMSNSVLYPIYILGLKTNLISQTITQIH